MSQIPSACYIERVSAHDIRHINQAKRAIKKAFQYQIDKKGFSMIEILGGCPVGWNATPVDSMKFIKDVMMPYFPLGVYCDRGAE